MERMMKDVLNGICWVAYVLLSFGIAYYLMLSFLLVIVYAFLFHGIDIMDVSYIAFFCSALGLFFIIYYKCLKTFEEIHKTLIKALKESRVNKELAKKYKPYEFKIFPTTCLNCGNKVFVVSLNPKAIGVCRKCILKGDVEKDA